MKKLNVNIISWLILLICSCGTREQQPSNDTVPVTSAKPSISYPQTKAQADSIGPETRNFIDVNRKRQGWWQITGAMEKNVAYGMNAVIEEGLFVDSVRKGLWRYYNPDGTLSKLIFYTKDRKQMFCAVTRAQADSMKLYDYSDENERPEGWWIITGKLAGISNSDRPLQEGLYVDGMKEGLWKIYNADGSVKDSAMFVKNVKQK